MPKLIFVYNADAGLMNGIFDSFHKILSPNTYSCSLCKITYNAVGMRPAWKSFLSILEINTEFLHKDEFINQFGESDKIALPTIFIVDKNQFLSFVSKEEIDKADLSELMKRIEYKLTHQMV